MKNISRVALLTVLLSASAPMFSEDTPNTSTQQTPPPATTKETPKKGYIATLTGIPYNLLVDVPQSISDYSIGGALKKVTEKIEYLKGGKLAKHADKFGLVVVYAVATYGFYKLYKYATAEKNITDEDFIFEDNTQYNS